MIKKGGGEKDDLQKTCCISSKYCNDGRMSS